MDRVSLLHPSCQTWLCRAQNKQFRAPQTIHGRLRVRTLACIVGRKMGQIQAPQKQKQNASTPGSVRSERAQLAVQPWPLLLEHHWQLCELLRIRVLGVFVSSSRLCRAQDVSILAPPACKSSFFCSPYSAKLMKFRRLLKLKTSRGKL